MNISDETPGNDLNQSIDTDPFYESAAQTTSRREESASPNSEPTEPTEANPVLYRAAGFWIRLLAFGIDLGVIACLNAILLNVVLPDTANQGSFYTLIETNALFLGLTGLAYFVLMTYYFSQTLGKMITGIQVVQRSGERLNWATVIFRELVGRSLSQLMGLNLGYIVCWFHSEKRCLHDILSDTWVVHVNPDPHPGCVAVERPIS